MFSRYGDTRQHLTITELMAINRTSRGELYARAEDSGCEGSYCEVARWDEATQRWGRYAFKKFFPDEHHSCWQKAQWAAGAINCGDEAVLIHSMPDYEGKKAKVSA